MTSEQVHWEIYLSPPMRLGGGGLEMCLRFTLRVVDAIVTFFQHREITVSHAECATALITTPAIVYNHHSQRQIGPSAVLILEDMYGCVTFTRSRVIMQPTAQLQLRVQKTRIG